VQIVEITEEKCEAEVDHLDEFILKIEKKKEDSKNEIIELKRQINLLDKELRLKDEAILHYQDIFIEDQNWILDIESKIEKERNLLKMDDRKNGFFNRIRK
jgi:hypothetical protein